MENTKTNIERGLYTPHLKDGTRLRLRLSDEDSLRMMMHGRRRGFKGQVTDTLTGKVYRIYGASCGLPHCMCDAIAVEV